MQRWITGLVKKYFIAMSCKVPVTTRKQQSQSPHLYRSMWLRWGMNLSFIKTTLSIEPHFISFTISSFCFVVCCSTHLLSLVFAGLKNMDQPLQLVSRIGGVHHQPEVFSSAEVHVERDHPQTRQNLHCVEPSISEITPKRRSCKTQEEKFMSEAPIKSPTLHYQKDRNVTTSLCKRQNVK